MTDFPARGQRRPQYWDLQLKAYIDEQVAAAALSRPGIANAGPLYAYGPSYYAGMGTSLSIHFNRLRRRLGSKTWINYGVPAFCAGDMSRFAYGTETYLRQGQAADEEGATTGVATWVPSTANRGLMLIDPFRNDAGLDGRTAGGGTTAKARAAAKNSLDTWLRLIRAGSITPWTDSSFVFTGSWATFPGVAGTRAGTLNYTTTAGDKFVKTWTGPDIDINLLALDDSSGLAGAPFTMKLDGVAYAPAGYPTTTGNQFRTTLMSAAFAPMSIPVRGAGAGVHTLEITKGSGANYLFVDCSMIPSPNPMTVVIEKVAALTTAGYNSYISTYGATGAGPAVDAVYNQIIDDVVARFPSDGSIVVVDNNAAGFNPATMVSTSDNLHRNDIGEDFIANNMFKTITALAPRDGLVKTL